MKSLIKHYIEPTVYIVFFCSFFLFSASYATQFRNKDSIILEEPDDRITMFGRTSFVSHELKLSADSIEYDFTNLQFIAKGKVHIDMKGENTEVTSDRLIYSFSEEGSGSFRKNVIQSDILINSIADVSSLFRGKAVFIDMWASWCEPCIHEFQNSETLYENLKKDGIEVLYISFDKDEKDENWKRAIKKYDVLGTHIRANKKLQDELTKFIWGGVDVFMLPNYLVMNKAGAIIEKHFLKPSQGEEFYIDLRKRLLRE
ncbi:MAG: redoxin domain-containing protein [Leadbetterella sp.]